MKLFRLSSVFTDLVQTAAVSGLVLISVIYVTRLLARGLGADEFGAYSLARRVISTVLTFTTLGMTIAIPRYLGFYGGSLERQRAYIFSGIVLISVPTVAFVLISVAFPNMISSAFFGGAQSKGLLHGTIILLIGLTLHMVAYAVFRGKLQMKYANALQILNISLVPLVVALFMARSFDASVVLLVMGLGVIVIAFGPLMWQLVSSWDALKSGLQEVFRDLIRYGVPRVPANIGLALMLTFGPWLTARLGEIREAGYFVAGQSVLGMLEEMLAAIGLVLLPRLAQLSGKHERDRLQGHVSSLVGFSLHLGIFASVQFSIFADWVTILWLGEEYRPAIPIMRTILASAGAYALYVSLRSVIDADEVRAINTRNIWLAFVMSLVVALVFYALGLSSLAFAIGLAVGVGILGLSTLLFVYRRFSLHSQRYHLGLALILNLGMGLTAYGLKWLVSLSYLALIYAIALEFIFVVIYGLVLKRVGVAWFKAITSRVSLGFERS